MCQSTQHSYRLPVVPGRRPAAHCGVPVQNRQRSCELRRGLRRSAPAGCAGALELAARDTAREADYEHGAPAARGAVTANGAAPSVGSAHKLQERDTAHEGEFAEGAAAATNGHAVAEYGGPVKHGMAAPAATNGAVPALPSLCSGL
jgi:hypothetical protein